MTIALLTPNLTPYRVPLFARLAREHDLEVLCYGGGRRYVPSWFADLDDQLATAPFAARRLGGVREALAVGRGYRAVIAPFAGGAVLPAAYVGAKRFGRPFVLWASVWVRPRSPAHMVARPAIDHIYRHADAVLAYGEHVRRFVASVRGRDDDVIVAPQAVEPELFARPVQPAEVEGFRAAHALGRGPLVLYVGRLATGKGVEVLLAAWPAVRRAATLVVIGDGPLAGRVAEGGPVRSQESPSGGAGAVRFLGSLPREQLAVAYAAAQFLVVPSVPTPRFVEPWGLVCNEAMYQGRPVIASDAVGAVAGGLVSNGRTGLVVPAGDPSALAGAIDRLLGDPLERDSLGVGARAAVAPYTYEAQVRAFNRGLEASQVTHVKRR